MVEVSDIYTEHELAALWEMARRTGRATISGVVRDAIWNHARHLDVEVPVTFFRGK